MRASCGPVLVDLSSTQILVGDISVSPDVDHAVVRLLVPDGAVVDSDDLRRIGRGE